MAVELKKLSPSCSVFIHHKESVRSFCFEEELLGVEHPIAIDVQSREHDVAQQRKLKIVELEFLKRKHAVAVLIDNGILPRQHHVGLRRQPVFGQRQKPIAVEVEGGK